MFILCLTGILDEERIKCKMQLEDHYITVELFRLFAVLLLNNFVVFLFLQTNNGKIIVKEILMLMAISVHQIGNHYGVNSYSY